MAEAAQDTGKLNVFISYSRDDIEFADQIDATLRIGGFDTLIDRHGIGGGEAWESRLGDMIRSADTIAFLLSPSSVRSKTCVWEVDEATRLGKRIIPLVCRPLEGEVPPPGIAALNYIFFYSEPRKPGTGFGQGLLELVSALNTDPGWLREHTRLLQRANEWDSGGRVANRLLSGRDVDAARAWAAGRPKEAPALTELHLEFLRASEEEEERRQDVEAQRLKQVAEAQAARGAALEEKEAAQGREAKQARLVVRRTLTGLAASLVLAVAAAGFAFYASQQKGEAVRTRDQALLAQSKFLADMSQRETMQEVDPGTGLLLALEALRDEASDDPVTRERPKWKSAEISLLGAKHLLREQMVLKGHDAGIASVAMMQNGTRIVTASDDGSARVWDATTGVELRRMDHRGRAVTGLAAMPDDVRIVTGSADGVLRIWDATTGAELVRQDGHGTKITGLAVTPDGTRIATGAQDGTVVVWDGAGTVLNRFGGGKDAILSVTVTPDGASVLTGLLAKNVLQRWDTRVTGGKPTSLMGHTGDIRGVAVTPDGTRIVSASSDNTIRMWNLATGAVGKTLDVSDSWVTSVAISRDGRRIVAGSDDNRARVFDAATGTEQLVLSGHEDAILSVAISGDGSRVVTGSADGTARIWDAKLKAEQRVFRGHGTRELNGVALSPDGSLVITCSDDKFAKVWDVRTGGELFPPLSGHTHYVRHAAVTPDGKRIVTVSSDKTARVWDASTGEFLGITFKGHTAAVLSVAVMPDGTRVVTGSDDGTARIWNIDTGKEIFVLEGHGNTVNSIAVTRDGRRIVTGSDDSTARIWDGDTYKLLRPLKGHKDYVLSVAVAPDGSRIITGSKDKTVRLWNAETGEELHRFPGHDGAVWGVTVSQDGTRIVSGGGDSAARVWDIETRTELLVLRGHAGTIRSVVVMPDGGGVVTASKDGTARLWNLPSAGLRGQDLIGEAKTLAPRCLTPVQRQRFHLSEKAPTWCKTMQKWPYQKVVGTSAIKVQQPSIVARR